MYKEILIKVNKDISRNYVKIKSELNNNVPLNKYFSKYSSFSSCC